METTDAGRLVDKSSVAMLACAGMELIIAGQMLSTSRAAANL